MSRQTSTRRGWIRIALAICILSGSGCQTREPTGHQERPLRVGFGIGKTARPESLPLLIDLLYAEPLFKREWSGRTTPHLIESWRWDADGRVLWFRLKAGVTFHDGTPLTGAVVAAQLAGYLTSTNQPARWGFVHVMDVNHDGDRSVTLRLSEPDMFLLAALSDIKIVHPDSAQLGTGPFRLVSTREEIRTERFENYHAGVPLFPGVLVLTYDTQRSAWAALMRDEVDAVQEVSRDSVEFMQGASELRTYSALQPFYVSLVVNHRDRLLGRVEMRRALHLGIDREEIVRVGMRGRGQATVNPIWPFHWAFEQRQDSAAPRRDVAAAIAELERLGMRLQTFPDAPPSRARIHTMVYSEDPQYERIALLLQRQLHDIGVDLVIQMLTMEEITKRIARGDFETYIVPTNASRTLERLYRAWHSGGDEGPAQLNTGYTGADDVLRNLRGSTDDASFRRNVQLLGRQFEEDIPAVFIAWMEVTRAVSRSVSVEDADDRDPFTMLWRWRPNR